MLAQGEGVNNKSSQTHMEGVRSAELSETACEDSETPVDEAVSFKEVILSRAYKTMKSINASLSDSDAVLYFSLCNTTTFKQIKLNSKLSHYKHRDYWKSTSTHLERTTVTFHSER